MRFFKLENKDILLEGTFIYLRPINEDDFIEIIKWRNDPEINRYLNQPYELNIDLQNKWYHEKYLQSQDILFVIIDKKYNKKIGTIGINDVDYSNKVAILGRLLIGEKEYRGSKELIEAMILIYDYLFYCLKLNALYGHCVIDNVNVISFDKKFGFLPTKETIYPEYCFVNGMVLMEMIDTLEEYEKSRKHLIKIIEYYKKSRNILS